LPAYSRNKCSSSCCSAGSQEPADVEVLRSIASTAFESILGRIDEAILPGSDKKILREKIAEIAQGYTFRPEDKVIAHFLSKLLSLFKEQQVAETDVREFVGLCNAYLTGKSSCTMTPDTRSP
jgi:hypothetical protein